MKANVSAVSALEVLGMEEGWMQSMNGASFYYRPTSTIPEDAFRDVRDFVLHERKLSTEMFNASSRSCARK